ncbi:DUF4279 domain-containing protein [Chitinophaga sp. Cy-1792]|uniref:DUF4279 domain-containing protein n=1 Tax=Chitinophaga sp. Cy-1792 TaxID=2608339 RepID=UPI0014235900|nr:DUF4279 domain-containing protein [Chitinophaga sp. Cy-1792]NIG55669.1 DUF4279 domain-containing protein [Chitinophaga sp. Cy-1792]
MVVNDLIQTAIEEIENQHWGVTKQFLEIHEVVYKDNKPKVENVKIDEEKGRAIVYFSIVGQKFYLAIYLDTKPAIAVSWIEIEPRYSIYFRATSEVLDYNELCAMTTLTPTNGWNKGDKRKFGELTYKFSCIEFLINGTPDEFKNKLEQLLDFLEQDKKGIIDLAHHANGYIQTIIIFHNGNTMLGGPMIDRKNITRISDLNLEINFDLYAEGKFYK